MRAMTFFRLKGARSTQPLAPTQTIESQKTNRLSRRTNRVISCALQPTGWNAFGPTDLAGAPTAECAWATSALSTSGEVNLGHIEEGSTSYFLSVCRPSDAAAS